MEDYFMIITPKELNDQFDDFTVIDIRPKGQRDESPLTGIYSVVSENGALPKIDGQKVKNVFFFF